MNIGGYTGKHIPAAARWLTVCIAVVFAASACGPRGPDTERRPELGPLYERLFDAFEARFGRDPRDSGLEADELAVDRIVNAANRLADRAAEQRRAAYRIDLPHIDLAGDEPDLGDPLHLEMTFSAEELEGLGVPVKGRTDR